MVPVHAEPSRAGRMFLAESYWPGIDQANVLARLAELGRTVQTLTTPGEPVEHIGSLLMTADGVVFTVVRASSEQIARDANLLAGLPVDRIGEVTTFGFTADRLQEEQCEI